MFKRLFKSNKMPAPQSPYFDLQNFYQNSTIPQITPIEAGTSSHERLRFNIMIPSLNQEDIFGGVNTALMFFDQLTKALGEMASFRIIITCYKPHDEVFHRFSSFTRVELDTDSDEQFQITPIYDRFGKKLPISPNDRFIATAWWTAYLAQTLVRQQSKLYRQTRKPMIYFIQDYEPGFYCWSSQSVLAESTYKSDVPIIAIFNTALLRDFFLNHEYGFSAEYHFEPRLNAHLKKKYGQFPASRKRTIAIYGRPSAPRNCLPVIVEALKKWVWLQPDVNQWQLISVGESHQDVDLGNGMILQSHGKLSLDDYAALLSESAIGISFMVSPHPSYPPLEMAHFGMLTLTNSFENKDLSWFHDNITSLNHLTPDTVAQALVELTDSFLDDPRKGQIGNSHIPYYLSDTQPFDFLDQFIEEVKSS